MTRCCPGCGRTDMAGITHVCPPLDTVRVSDPRGDWWPAPCTCGAAALGYSCRPDCARVSRAKGTP